MTTGFAGRFNPNVSANLSVNLVESSKICPNVLKKRWCHFRTKTEVRGIRGFEKSFVKSWKIHNILFEAPVRTYSASVRPNCNPFIQRLWVWSARYPQLLSPEKAVRESAWLKDTNPSCQTLPKSEQVRLGWQKQVMSGQMVKTKWWLESLSALRSLNVFLNT